MKTISFIPKRWKRYKASYSRDTSLPLQEPFPDTHTRLPIEIASSTSSTLVERTRDWSPSWDKSQNLRRDNIAILDVFVETSEPRDSPKARHDTLPARPEHSPVKSLDTHARIRAPSGDVTCPPPRRLPSFETLRPPLQATSNPVPSAAYLSSGSPTSMKFHAPDQHLPRSHAQVPSPRSARPKRSMPELDGVWQGFLDDVKENLDSIRSDLASIEDVQCQYTTQVPFQPGSPVTPRHSPLAINRPLLSESQTQRSPISSTFRSRARSTSHSEPALPQHPGTTPSSPHYSSENRHGPLESGDIPEASGLVSHERGPSDVSADFPLSLFPVPPPLIQGPNTMHLPSTITAQSLPTVDISAIPTPISSTPPRPPRSERRHTPKPLDIRSTRSARPLPSPVLDSPPPSTPTTPRSPQFFYSPMLRTTGSPASILKKKSSHGRPQTSPLMTPPSTPDYFGYLSSSPEPSPSEPEKTFERPNLRPAFSSSNLGRSATPPAGAHRATLSESVHSASRTTDGKIQTISRPDVSLHHRPLLKDAYMVGAYHFLLNWILTFLR
jgi:hypothetical protein